MFFRVKESLSCAALVFSIVLYSGNDLNRTRMYYVKSDLKFLNKSNSTYPKMGFIGKSDSLKRLRVQV